jgi:hypothetical protein
MLFPIRLHIFGVDFTHSQKIYPELSSNKSFKAGDILVIIARPPRLFDRVRIALDDLNLMPKELGDETLVDEKGPYEILVVSAERTRPP